MTISASVRSPAIPARYSSAATVTSRNRLGGLLGVRPRPDPHRVETRVAERQRQVALRRVAVVRPAAETVEPVAERRQRTDDVARLDAPEDAPERVLLGELERRRLDGVGDDGLDQPGHLELPATARLGVAVGQDRDERGHRLAVAAQQPEDPRRPAAVVGDAERSSSSSRGSHGSLGAAGTWKAASVVEPLVALRDERPRLEAGRVGVLGADPGGVRLEPEPLERRTDLRGRGVLAGGRRGRLAGLGVDPVDLARASRAPRPRARRATGPR